MPEYITNLEMGAGELLSAREAHDIAQSVHDISSVSPRKRDSFVGRVRSFFQRIKRRIPLFSYKKKRYTQSLNSLICSGLKIKRENLMIDLND